MPFFGIVDTCGKELRCKGYHRIDAGITRFKISPPQSAVDHMTMVNVDQVQFPIAQEDWTNVGDLALYDEPDSDVPLITCPLSTGLVHAHSLIAMSPGSLRIGVNYRRPGANDPAPPDEYGRLREGLMQAQQHNIKLQMEAAAKVSLLQQQKAKLINALQVAKKHLRPTGLDCDDFEAAYDHVCKTLEEVV